MIFLSETNKNNINSNKVQVKIYGKEYTLRGYESKEYIQSVAHYVDKKMVEISKNSMRMNVGVTSVLTAVNIADEYFKLQQSISEIKDELKKKTSELESYKDEIDKVKVNYTQSQLELAKMKSELEGMKRK